MHGSAVFRTSAAASTPQVQSLRQQWPSSATPGNSVSSPKIDARMLQVGGSFGAPPGAPVVQAAHLRGGVLSQQQQQQRGVSPLAQRPCGNGSSQQPRTMSPPPQATATAPGQLQSSMSMSRLVFQQDHQQQQPLELARSPSLASAAMLTASVVPASSAASREPSYDARATVVPQSARTVSPNPGWRTTRDMEACLPEVLEARDTQRMPARPRSPSETRSGSVPRSSRTTATGIAVPVSTAPSFAAPISIPPKQVGQFNGQAPAWASPQNSPNISPRVPVGTGNVRRSEESNSRPPSPSRPARTEVGEPWSRPRPPTSTASAMLHRDAASPAPHHEREKPRKNDIAGRIGRQGNRTGAALTAPWASTSRTNTTKRESSGRTEIVALEEPSHPETNEGIDEPIMREVANLKNEGQAVLRGDGRRLSEVQREQAQRDAERERELDARVADVKLMEEEFSRAKAARERELANREQQLALREQDLATREAEFHSGLRAREQKILSREERVAEREEQLISRTKRCAEREAEVADRAEQTKAAERELAAEKQRLEREQTAEKQRLVSMLKDQEDKVRKEEEKMKKRERAVEERELRWGEACKDAYVLKQCHNKSRFSPRNKENSDLQKQLEEQQSKVQEIKRKPTSWGADYSPSEQNENSHPDQNVLA